MVVGNRARALRLCRGPGARRPPDGDQESGPALSQRSGGFRRHHSRQWDGGADSRSAPPGAERDSQQFHQPAHAGSRPCPQGVDGDGFTAENGKWFHEFKFKGDEVMASATAVSKQKVHRGAGDGQGKQTQPQRRRTRARTRRRCWSRRRSCAWWRRRRKGA